MAESPTEDEKDGMFHSYVQPLITGSIIEPTAEGKNNLKHEIEKSVIASGRFHTNIKNHSFVKFYDRWFKDKAQDYASEKSIISKIKQTKERGVEFSRREESEIITYSQKGSKEYRNAKESLLLMQSAGKGLTSKSKKAIQEHIFAYGSDDIKYHGFLHRGKMKMGVWSRKKKHLITTWFIK